MIRGRRNCPSITSSFRLNAKRGSESDLKSLYYKWIAEPMNNMNNKRASFKLRRYKSNKIGDYVVGSNAD